MKKGFTLIELLAVIVILAIIALIATPIVLSIINDSKNSAILRSADNYLDTVGLSITSAMLHNKKITDGVYNITDTGDICLEDTVDSVCNNILELSMKGQKPNGGSITIEEGRVEKVTLLYNNKTVIKDQNNELVFGTEEDQILAPGLYDENGKLTYSWEQLISEEIIVVTEDAASIGVNGALLFGKLVIDEHVTRIGDYGFVNCSSLTSIIIPNSVTTIGESAFANCTSLKSITLGNSVTRIEDYVFFNCSSLTSVIIPNSVTTIGESVFSGCTSLKSMIIPESVTRIGEGILSRCTSLESIKVDKNNTVYDSRDESNAIIETSTNTLIVGCKNTVIPNDVTALGAFSFAFYTDLKSITIPNSVTSIESNAFYDCTNLTTIYYSGTATGSPWGATYATIVTE